MLLGQASAFRSDNDRLTHVSFTLRDEQKTVIELPVDDLLVFFGSENWSP